MEELAGNEFSLTYYDTCTQEDYVRKGRLWEHVEEFTEWRIQ